MQKESKKIARPNVILEADFERAENRFNKGYYAKMMCERHGVEYVGAIFDGVKDKDGRLLPPEYRLKTNCQMCEAERMR